MATNITIACAYVSYPSVLSTVRNPQPQSSSLMEITFPAISRPPPHITRGTAPPTWLHISWQPRDMIVAVFTPLIKLIWLICAMIACGRFLWCVPNRTCIPQGAGHAIVIGLFLIWHRPKWAYRNAVLICSRDTVLVNYLWSLLSLICITGL